MKTTKLHIITILIATILAISPLPAFASCVPRETIPENTPQSAVDVAESYIGATLSKVQNGMGYADAKGEANRLLFNAFLNNQTSGYSYGLLTVIANNAIFEYSNIVINKLESLLRTPNCPFVLYVGTKKLVKRKESEYFLSSISYI